VRRVRPVRRGRARGDPVPSFFRAEIVQNPGWWDRALARVRSVFISWLAPA